MSKTIIVNEFQFKKVVQTLLNESKKSIDELEISDWVMERGHFLDRLDERLGGAIDLYVVGDLKNIIEVNGLYTSVGRYYLNSDEKRTIYDNLKKALNKKLPPIGDNRSTFILLSDNIVSRANLNGDKEEIEETKSIIWRGKTEEEKEETKKEVLDLIEFDRLAFGLPTTKGNKIDLSVGDTLVLNAEGNIAKTITAEFRKNYQRNLVKAEDLQDDGDYTGHRKSNDFKNDPEKVSIFGKFVGKTGDDAKESDVVNSPTLKIKRPRLGQKITY